MPKPIIKIVDHETGETIEREMTNAEFAEYDAGNKAKAKAEADAAARKAALLEKLGITEEEAQLLLS